MLGHACCYQLGADEPRAWRAGAERETALKEFYEAWKGEPLVLLKWISIQARRPPACPAWDSELRWCPERCIPTLLCGYRYGLNPNPCKL